MLKEKFLASDKTTEIEIYDDRRAAVKRVEEVKASKDPLITVLWWNDSQGVFKVAITHRKHAH